MTTPHISAGARVRIELPWPAKALHPNARPHRMEKARSVKKARRDADVMTRAAACNLHGDRLNVIVTFRPPSRRGDTDNMLAACKAYFDGIADATRIDDRHFTITAQRGEPVKGGAVLIELEAA